VNRVLIYLCRRADDTMMGASPRSGWGPILGAQLALFFLLLRRQPLFLQKVLEELLLYGAGFLNVEEFGFVGQSWYTS